MVPAESVEGAASVDASWAACTIVVSVAAIDTRLPLQRTRLQAGGSCCRHNNAHEHGDNQQDDDDAQANHR